MKIKGVKNIEFLAKGKRSKVYTGMIKGKKVAIKVSTRAGIEAGWLKILNKKRIGPEIITPTEDILIYTFVEGERILDYIKNHNNTYHHKYYYQAHKNYP